MLTRSLLTLVVLCGLSVSLYAAPKTGFTSFVAGNPADAQPSQSLSPGLVLMGGGTDVDAAFQWMCQRAGGGDFLVIRTTGTDAYNPYIQQLCPQMDSVETIIITSVTGANSAYVSTQIQNAEALWIAGGDQSTYVALWRGTAVQTGVNFLLNSKQAPVGGTSAGLAVLSQFIYTGAVGSVTSSQALANPFHRYVTLDRDLFQSSLGGNKLYDSHFVTRDRLGRSLVFLARIVNNGWAAQPRGDRNRRGDSVTGAADRREHDGRCRRSLFPSGARARSGARGQNSFDVSQYRRLQSSRRAAPLTSRPGPAPAALLIR